MKRREFHRRMMMLGAGVPAGVALAGDEKSDGGFPDHFREAPKKLPARSFDVVVAGGGTAGVVAAATVCISRDERQIATKR